jgi:uncharacterized paraquat-inducible protein A
MDGSIHIHCPGCRASVKAPAELAGQIRPCPRCGRRLLLRFRRENKAAGRRPVPAASDRLGLRLRPAPKAPPTDTAIRLSCPGCQAAIKAVVELAGQTRPCPRCGQALVIPGTRPEDSGPMLLGDEGGPALAPVW